MRYENWDVLLFPAKSKVPVQEFKTQCFVTRDRGTLPADSPFRVSIHSWEPPHVGVALNMSSSSCRGSVFPPRTNWPHVIGKSSNVDKNGNQDTLRFPPFHQEILEQRHWDAGDLHGRIRVVVAEGFARPHRNPPFERVKEIIAFAFQHAPLNVLEYSSIAWPNTSMWSKEPRLFKYNAGSGVSDPKEAEDSHAHSPAARHDETRPPVAPITGQIGNPPALNFWRNRSYQGPVPQWQGNYREPRWAPPETVFADPFIDPYVLDPAARHRGARQSWEDISMPDYVSNSSGSRAISSMTGISYEHSKHPSLVAPIGDDAYSQLIQALSPTKQPACSTQPPTTASATTAIPMGTKLSAAAEARSASHRKSGNSRASANILEDMSCSNSRDVSGSTTAASNTTPPDPAAEQGAAAKLHASPSGPIKSRKEGISLENKENEAEKACRDSDKARQTPSKLNVLTNSGVETPTDGRKRRSVNSSRDDCLIINKKEPVLLSPTLLSPTQDLSRIKDSVHKDGFDRFLDSQSTLVSPTAEVDEVE
ncbi:uncharacterized protein BDW70DRAFT_167155 [Aspergillus foveolatus]|uniref:uncharacterized protein n=1 Tax=Aspergillus foveolatus TaxID=210207 RepID=UPI003CCD09CF